MQKPTKALAVLCLLLFLFPSLAMSADVTLAWDPVTDDNIAGYHIYARETGESYNYDYPEWEGSTAQATLTGFDGVESYYFVVRAYDADGEESGDSNEVFWSPSSTVQPDSNLGSTSGADAGGGGCFISDLIAD